MNADAAYDQLIAHHRRTAAFASTTSVLGWDQRTMMPAGAAAWRGEQIAALADLIHERQTDARIEDWLKSCEDAGWSTGEDARSANLQRMRRDYDLTIRIPQELAGRMAQAQSDAYGAWIAAREQNDFAAYRPHLETVLELSRQQAGHLATHDDPYDTLFDCFEEGMTGDAFAELMQPVIPRLQQLVQRVAQTDRPTLGPGPFADKDQTDCFWALAQAMGFAGSGGRLDTTVHPFCSGMGPQDVRMTTRYHDDDLLEGLSTTMHEMGHGLYEQGLPADHFGLPLGESVSLGIHESQSRLWENHIGRTAAFGRWLLPQLEERFGDRFDTIDAEEYHRRQCAVVPGYIRVDADEATYDLHIWLRFGLERAMIRGDLAVADLPQAWNSRFEELFGFPVDRDANGCLQDVHWSAAFGYFPTYTLGNCYAAQLMTTIRSDLPDLDEQVAAGDFAPLLGWLREHIHQHGRRHTPRRLFERATGSELDAEHLMRHIESRYG